MKKTAATRNISSNVATLRGHKGKDATPAAVAAGAASSNNAGAGAGVGSEYPVLEVYNVGIYVYANDTKSWSATDQGSFSRLFVTHNPATMAYRLLGVKQNEGGAVGLNTPIPANMVVVRKGRFVQFRDRVNVYLLAFTSKDDSAIFAGIVAEIRRESEQIKRGK